MATAPTYPLRIEAELDPELSRWLWLVKWLLAIPHFIALVFLWVAYAVLTLVAFVAILVTGRYPSSIFRFNVGVLRWTWRVGYYSYGANGTDRYPPFTLDEVPGYPTRLQVDEPERLSRGLVLVKWLLALPHLVVVAILAGGGSLWAWNVGDGEIAMWGNLIGVLVVVAVVVLLFTRSYPQPLFDLILGLNRWVFRVAAYVGLMTDEYPPFRLDMGGTEPGGAITTPPTPERPPPAPARGGWSGGRVTSVVIGSLLVLGSLGLLGAGGSGLWLDRTQRDADGYLWARTDRLTTGSYAVTTERIELWRDTSGWVVPIAYVLGDVRISVLREGGSGPVFVGIAPTRKVDRYLDGVARAVISGGPDAEIDRTLTGGAPPGPPSERDLWVSSGEGVGSATVDWEAEAGSWSIVAMNADGSGGLDVRLQLGATLPALLWIAVAVLIGGGVLLVVGSLLIGVPAIRAARQRSASAG